MDETVGKEARNDFLELTLFFDIHSHPREHFIRCQPTSIPYDDRIQVLADEHRFEYIVYIYITVWSFHFILIM
jgi:hypothetical protein